MKEFPLSSLISALARGDAPASPPPVVVNVDLDHLADLFAKKLAVTPLKLDRGQSVQPS